MLQYEVRFLTKLPDHCGVIKWTNFRYRAECDTKKRALPKGRTRGRGGEGVPLPPYRGNDLCMTVVYCALAGSAG